MTLLRTDVMDDGRYHRWEETAIGGRPLDRADAGAILDGGGIDLMRLLAAAGRVRRRRFGDTVTIHVLDNVRNGACPEDCGYCGQSSDSSAAITPYKLKPVDAIVADAEAARDRGAYRFCMALAGRGPTDGQVEHMAAAIERIAATGMRTCLSAGLLDEAKARRLREAGLDRLNHNLNTSRRRYPAICSTHTYDDRLETLRAARAAGIGLCSGLIVGMGESHDDLLDVLYELAAVGAESLPVNFLLPIEGNRVREPVCGGRALEPQFVLRVLCVARLIHPAAEVRIAAGREHHLRSMQPLALWPANSLFMDGYLLTEGTTPDETIRMIRDAGFEPVLEHGEPLKPSAAGSTGTGPETREHPAGPAALKANVRAAGSPRVAH